jgi:hypothetical protein
VLAAGIPAAWLAGGAEVAVRGLPTYFGRLDLSLRREREGSLRVAIGGGLALPPGGIAVRPPLPGPIERVDVRAGRLASFDAESATIGALPAELAIHCRASTPTR